MTGRVKLQQGAQLFARRCRSEAEFLFGALPVPLKNDAGAACEVAPEL